MKKIAIIITALFINVNSGSAQESSTETDNREKFQFGLKAGLNNSNIYDEQGQEFSADSKFGFVGGATFAIPIGKYLGIQPEILLSQKGFEGSGMVLGNWYHFTRTTTFIDIPLQFAFKPAEFITFLGGPQYSYLLKQRDTFTTTTSSFEQEKEFEHDNIRKNIFGVVGGVDINLNHFTIGGRVAWDIQNNNGDGTSTTPRYKNVWFQGTIGYRFFN